MIKSISVRELRPNIPKVIDDIHERFDRYIINRRGKPEIVMLSIEDYESLLETLEMESDKGLMQRLKKSQKDIASGKGKELEKIHKELGIV